MISRSGWALTVAKPMLAMFVQTTSATNATSSSGPYHGRSRGSMTSSASAVSMRRHPKPPAATTLGRLVPWTFAPGGLDYRVGRGLRRPDVNNRREITYEDITIDRRPDG